MSIIINTYEYDGAAVEPLLKEEEIGAYHTLCALDGEPVIEGLGYRVEFSTFAPNMVVFVTAERVEELAKQLEKKV